MTPLSLDFAICERAGPSALEFLGVPYIRFVHFIGGVSCEFGTALWVGEL